MSDPNNNDEIDNDISSKLHHLIEEVENESHNQTINSEDNKEIPEEIFETHEPILDDTDSLHSKTSDEVEMGHLSKSVSELGVDGEINDEGTSEDVDNVITFTISPPNEMEAGITYLVVIRKQVPSETVLSNSTDSENSSLSF